jgi:endonuclease/exonuclease/phosphatase family metal-dependent hydrolase
MFRSLLLLLLAVSSFCEALHIGAFNCRVFGVTKVAEAALVQRIATILARYDLLLFQEIRDASGLAIELLLNQTRMLSQRDYRMIVSSRLGRTTSKEQYAYIYDHALVTVEGAGVVWADQNDLFERPPFIAEFRDLLTQSRFVLMGLHAKPEDAVAEMSALVTVYDDIVDNYGDMVPIILLGDFNADCQYVAASAWPNVRLWSDPRFQWHIATGVDTTVTNSDCTFDRVVSARLGNQTTISGALAWDFQAALGLSQTDALAISDHFPVEFVIGLPVQQPAGLSGGAVAGIVIGLLVITALLVSVAIFVYRNRGYNPGVPYSQMDSGERFDELR